MDTNLEEANPVNSHEENEAILKGALTPLVNELKLPRESMDSKYDKLEAKYTNLESAISQQKHDVTSEICKLEQSLATEWADVNQILAKKMDTNTKKLGEIMEENRLLHRECNKLQEHLSKFESIWLNNNVILTGLSEQPWEDYKITKQRVLILLQWL